MSLSLNIREFLENRIAILLACLVAAFLGWVIPSRISIVLTPSIGKTLFVITEKGQVREVSNGDYVHIDLLSVLGSQDAPQDKEVREALKKYNTCLLSKVVACTAGQHLVTRGNDYYCDFRYIGTAKDKTRLGTPTHKVIYDEIIPQGQFFAMGYHAESYDSKYFGLVRMEQVKGKLFPVF